MIAQPVIAAVTCLIASCAFAPPVDDVGSPSQQVRDAAARTLRRTFIAEPRSRWQPAIAEIKYGDFKESVLQRLQPFAVTTEFAIGFAHSFSESYRFDDTWVLSCTFRKSGSTGVLLRHELQEVVRSVWVTPPKSFTGVRVTYFANGQRSYEIHYVNGRYFGTFTSFHSNGSRAVVQHYNSFGEADGEDTGYFPSGQVKYRGQHRNGSQVGTWIHYNEDGSVSSIKEHVMP